MSQSRHLPEPDRISVRYVY